MPFGSTDVSDAFAARHHGVVMRFLGALDKSFDWINNSKNRDEAVDILASEMRTKDREDIAKSYDYMRKIGHFQPNRDVSKKRLEEVMTAMAAIGDTNGKVPLDKLLLPGVSHVVE
ncbi:MAG: hypothetical protein ACREFQ_15465 [Stellaceae bacterium]